MRLSIVILIVVGLLHPVYCDKNDWWKELLARASARHANSKVLASVTPTVKEPSSLVLDTESAQTAQTTIRPVRKSGHIFAATLKSPEEATLPSSQSSKNWDKSYSKVTRKSYKRTWSNVQQPSTEKIIETEWDDDVSDRPVAEDVSSGNKEKIDRQLTVNHSPKQQQFGDRASRQLIKVVISDQEKTVRPTKVTLSNGNRNEQPNQAYVKVWDNRTNKQKQEGQDVIGKKLKDNWDKGMDSWSKLAKNNFDEESEWEQPNKQNLKDYNDPNNDYSDTETPNSDNNWEEVTSTTSAKPPATSAKLRNENTEKATKKPSRFGWRTNVNYVSEAPAKQRATTNSFTSSVEYVRPKEVSTSKTSARTTIRTTTKATTRATTIKAPTRSTTKSTSVASVERQKLKSPANVITTKDQNKQKQHRIGNWIDSERLREREEVTEDSVSSQPLQEQEYDDRVEQLPERVEVTPAKRQGLALQREKPDYDTDVINGRLEDTIPGTPEKDYPTYSTIPTTTFSCKNHEWPGYYADVEAGCQVFHICQMGGRKNSFLCPNGTVFNQRVFVCDWWHNVECSDSTSSYTLNQNLYDYSFESKRQQPVRRSGSQEEFVAPISSSSTEKPNSPSETETEDDDNSEDDESDSESAISASRSRAGSESGNVYYDDGDSYVKQQLNKFRVVTPPWNHAAFQSQKLETQAENSR